MSRHTFLPWKVDDSRRYDHGIHIREASNATVFRPAVASWLSEADAEFIVRACNAHYDLLEALVKAAHFVTCPAHPKHMDGCARCEATRAVNEAIARATGEDQ